MIKVDTLLDSPEILITRFQSPYQSETINIVFKNTAIDERKVERLVELFKNEQSSNKTVKHHSV